MLRKLILIPQHTSVGRSLHVSVHLCTYPLMRIDVFVTLWSHAVRDAFQKPCPSKILDNLIAS